MELLIECRLKCVPILIDNADIVRGAISRQQWASSLVADQPGTIPFARAFIETNPDVSLLDRPSFARDRRRTVVLELK